MVCWWVCFWNRWNVRHCVSAFEKGMDVMNAIAFICGVVVSIFAISFYVMNKTP